MKTQIKQMIYDYKYICPIVCTQNLSIFVIFSSDRCKSLKLFHLIKFRQNFPEIFVIVMDKLKVESQQTYPLLHGNLRTDHLNEEPYIKTYYEVNTKPNST